jgi:hypothetical protein
MRQLLSKGSEARRSIELQLSTPKRTASELILVMLVGQLISNETVNRVTTSH